MMVAVLAGNRAEFKNWMEDHVPQCIQGGYFYVWGNKTLDGLCITDYHIVGTFWTRSDSHRLASRVIGAMLKVR